MDVLVMPVDAGEPEGPEVVRKTASLPGERQRLLREAEVLQAAAELGVPGLATVVTAPSAEVAEPFLVTVAVAGPSLAVAAPLPVLEVAGVAAEVARLLAGLHDAGLVHGAVEPSHVVLDGAGGAILVGLGDGGRAGAPAPDPAGGILDPADDVAGWGALVTHLLDWSATTEEEPLVALRRALATRQGRRRRPPDIRPGQAERRVLAALADQAQEPDPARRPAARSLAAALTHRVPAARMPGGVGVAPPLGPGGLLGRLSPHLTMVDRPAGPAGPEGPTPGSGDGGRRRPPERGGNRPERARRPGRRRGSSGTSGSPAAGTSTRGSEPLGRTETTGSLPAPAAAPAYQVALRRRPAVPTWLSGRAGGGRLVVAVLAVAVAVLGIPAAASRLRPAVRNEPVAGAAPVPARCRPVTPPAADVDGDGCEEPVGWSAGILHAGAARFALGAPGDAWAVGDWDCDGRRTPALLRGGTLTVFDAWPGPGGELQGRQVAGGTGATGLAAVRAGGCDRPALSRAGRPDLVLDPGAPP